MNKKLKVTLLAIGITFVITLIVVIVFSNRILYELGFNSTWPDTIQPSIVDVDKNFPFPKDFPPDPGEEGKKTIEGIDSDQDGIRDDVQRWIYAWYPKEPQKQMSLRQLARFYQHSLQSEFGPETKKKNIEMMDRALACNSQTFKDMMQDYIGSIHLEAKMLNTYERTRRFLKNDSKFTTEEMSGELRPVKGDPCDHR